LGLFTIWPKESFNCERIIIGREFLAMAGKLSKENISVMIMNVYSPCNLSEKCQLWAEIVQIRIMKVCKTWCMVGNFNIVMTVEDSRGLSQQNSYRCEVRELNQFIENMETLDIPMVKKKFIWYKSNKMLRVN